MIIHTIATCAIITIAAAAAPPRYEAIEIISSDGTTGWGRDLNNFGQVLLDDNEVWTPNGNFQLITQDPFQSYRFSDVGVAIGHLDYFYRDVGMWSPEGGAVTLPESGGRTFLTDISPDSLFVAGLSNSMPALWHDGTLTQPTLPVEYESGSYEGVSNQGHAVGSVGIPELEGVTFRQWYGIYTHTGETTLVTEVPGIPENQRTFIGLNAVNDNGHAIGSTSDITHWYGMGTAFRYQDGLAEILPHLPHHTRSSAIDLNNNGTIVGSSFTDEDGFQSATIWIDDAPFNLNDLLDTDIEGHRLLNAYAINERGEILVRYGRNEANASSRGSYLLRPIPSPSTIALTSLSACFIAGRRRRSLKP